MERNRNTITIRSLQCTISLIMSHLHCNHIVIYFDSTQNTRLSILITSQIIASRHVFWLGFAGKILSHPHNLKSSQGRNTWNQVLILLRIFKSSENHCVILHRESDACDLCLTLCNITQCFLYDSTRFFPVEMCTLGHLLRGERKKITNLLLTVIVRFECNRIKK